MQTSTHEPTIVAWTTRRRRDRLRSFLLGGLVGASAAIAAAAAAAAARAARRETPAGLAAFEEAPCFRETIERERGVADARAGARARSTV